MCRWLARTAATGAHDQQGSLQAGLGMTDDDRDNESATAFERACLSRVRAPRLWAVDVAHP